MATPSSPLRIETEREKEVCQRLKQASEEAERLRDELRQAAQRETQLQNQLDQMNLYTKYRDSKTTGRSTAVSLSCYMK